MNTKKIILAVFAFQFIIGVSYAQWSDWEAPAEADTLVNPILEANDAVLAEGQIMWTSMCFLCHGDTGKGDGLQAASLTKPPADLTSPQVQRQSDGALFWKITTGNDPMLAFDYYTEEQRWQLVHYIRSLAGEEIVDGAKENSAAGDGEEIVEEGSYSPFDFNNPNDIYIVIIMGLVFFVIIVLLLTIRVTLMVMKVVKAEDN